MYSCFICAYFAAVAQRLLQTQLFSLSSCSAAEKVSSLGKDWHKFCLKCERCNKTLNPGGHAEVQSTGGSAETTATEEESRWGHGGAALAEQLT